MGGGVGALCFGGVATADQGYFCGCFCAAWLGRALQDWA